MRGRDWRGGDWSEIVLEMRVKFIAELIGKGNIYNEGEAFGRAAT
jgi:hypothetical protein